MVLRVALLRTDVSEEVRTAIISVTRIGELGTTLEISSNRLKCYITEDHILHAHRRENLKSYSLSYLH
jgi:hypothetical protein